MPLSNLPNLQNKYRLKLDSLKPTSRQVVHVGHKITNQLEKFEILLHIILE